MTNGVTTGYAIGWNKFAFADSAFAALPSIGIGEGKGKGEGIGEGEGKGEGEGVGIGEGVGGNAAFRLRPPSRRTLRAREEKSNRKKREQMQSNASALFGFLAFSAKPDSKEAELFRIFTLS